MCAAACEARSYADCSEATLQCGVLHGGGTAEASSARGVCVGKVRHKVLSGCRTNGRGHAGSQLYCTVPLVRLLRAARLSVGHQTVLAAAQVYYVCMYALCGCTVCSECTVAVSQAGRI